MAGTLGSTAAAASGWSQFCFTVANEESGQRLDHYLTSRQLRLTRSRIKKCIDSGNCHVNRQCARPSQRLKSGDLVVFHLPPAEPDEVSPEAIELAVLYEDPQLIVVAKPAGMVVHPGAGHHQGTLVAALLGHCEQLSGVGGRLRPGIVHRLDKLTSGVLVASKCDEAHLGLAEQFKAHSIERRYLALVGGHLASACGSFDTLHGRHPKDRKRFSSRVERGRRAVTHYRRLQLLNGATLVEACLETGRTHQVRVHFADAGHALLGDPLYARLPPRAPAREAARLLGRQALHAHVLAFEHPRSGQRLRFVAPMPKDMSQALDRLGSAGDHAHEEQPCD